MKLLITGSRKFHDYAAFCEALAAKHISHIFHGGAKGTDQLATRYAAENNIPCTVIRPNYQRYGRNAAPLKRNSALVALADETFAFYGQGRNRKGGTWDAAKKTIAANKLLTERLSDGTIRTTTPKNTLF